MPIKKEKYIVIVRETMMVEYLVEATSHNQAQNKVYDGEGEPIRHYNEDMDVSDVLLASEYKK